MARRTLVFLMLSMSVNAAAAGTSAKLLGVGYTEWLAGPTRMATDSTGALYLLGACPISGGSASCVTKLSADGKTILWRDVLGFQTNAMAVSPSGDVFVVPSIQPSDTSMYVAKLGAAGAGVAWRAAAGFLPPANVESAPVLAADSQGRAYVAALSGTTVVDHAGAGVTTVVRVNASGNTIDYSARITGTATFIGADRSGAVTVAGYVVTDHFVTRLAADGSVAYTFPSPGVLAMTLDADGNAVIVATQGGSAMLQRLNAQGTVTVSTRILAAGSYTQLALDSTGNAYVLGLTTSPEQPRLHNNIAPCVPTTIPVSTSAGTAPVLTVIAPDGSVPQVTYVPGSDFAAPDNGSGNTLLLATGPNSTVLVATGPAPGFVPTQEGPFPEAAPPGATILAQLSPITARPIPLACVVHAATFFPWAVAPGEIVALMGSGLGPIVGVETQGTPQSPFPSQIAGVQVTFDGAPAPLLWVQDSQINAIVPWSLEPGANTEICAYLAGTKTNCLTWPIARTAPGVFHLDGFHAAALNEDGTVNSAANPAAPGSTVSIFATGLGPITPPPTDGVVTLPPLPSNVLQVGVVAYRITRTTTGIPNGETTTPVPVSYAGPAPYLVAGVCQINFQIPAADSALPTPDGYYLTLLSKRGAPFGIYVVGQ